MVGAILIDFALSVKVKNNMYGQPTGPIHVYRPICSQLRSDVAYGC